MFFYFMSISITEEALSMTELLRQFCSLLPPTNSAVLWMSLTQFNIKTHKIMAIQVARHIIIISAKERP